MVFKAFLLSSCLSALSKAIEAFEDYNDELKARPAHPVCGHGRFSPGVIRGGDIASSVPDFWELEVDRRTIVGESLDDVVSEYRQRLDPLAAQIPGFRYDIGPATINNDALDTPEDSPIVEQATEAFRQTLGRAPALAPFSGGTDAPNLLCPAVICGPGSIQQAHTLDEFVEIDQLTQAVKIYLRSILALQQVE